MDEAFFKPIKGTQLTVAFFYIGISDLCQERADGHTGRNRGVQTPVRLGAMELP